MLNVEEPKFGCRGPCWRYGSLQSYRVQRQWLITCGGEKVCSGCAHVATPQSTGHHAEQFIVFVCLQSAKSGKEIFIRRLNVSVVQLFSVHLIAVVLNVTVKQRKSNYSLPI